MEITRDEQLDQWLDGNSIHRGDKVTGECTPDFSCCCPELLALKEEREKFVRYWKEGRMDATEAMFEGFFRTFIKKRFPDKKIHIVGFRKEVGDEM